MQTVPPRACGTATFPGGQAACACAADVAVSAPTTTAIMVKTAFIGFLPAYLYVLVIWIDGRSGLLSRLSAGPKPRALGRYRMRDPLAVTPPCRSAPASSSASRRRN